MSLDAFSSAYKKAVKAKIERLEHDLGRGKAASFEEYKEQAGYRNGLDEALKLFQETIRKYAELEEDDE